MREFGGFDAYFNRGTEPSAEGLVVVIKGSYVFI